jgi:[ribosomal protein S5]-alanine N-acetyltransferase
MYPAKLTARTVLLREFRPDDTGGLYRVYGDVEATRHLSFEPKTVEEVESVIKSAIKTAVVDPRVEYMLAVEDIASGELIGAARLALTEYQSAQIGFALRPDNWGQGKGTETVLLLERLGFEELGLHRIWGARSPLNENSARTMLKAGMIEEGIIRGHLYTRGAWRDSVVHSILSDEYPPAMHGDHALKA